MIESGVRAIEEDVLAVDNKNRTAIEEQKKLTRKKNDLVEVIKPSELSNLIESIRLL